MPKRIKLVFGVRVTTEPVEEDQVEPVDLDHLDKRPLNRSISSSNSVLTQ